MPTKVTKAQGNLHKLKFSGVHVNSEVEFYAFITSFSQNFTSTWNTEPVYGRVDPIATFQGNQRTLNLSWDVPSENLKVATKNLKKFNKLAQLIYPAYSSVREKVDVETSSTDVGDTGGTEVTVSECSVSINALTLSKPPLLRLKYANLVAFGDKGLLGFVGSISWNPIIEMGLFNKSGNLYPKVFSLNVDFNALHEEDLGWNAGKFQGASFPFGG